VRSSLDNDRTLENGANPPDNAALPERSALFALAELAGVITHWDDAQGRAQALQPAALQRVLAAMSVQCGDAAQVEASRARLSAADDAAAWPGLAPLLTAELATPIRLRCAAAAYAGDAAPPAYEIVLEDGARLSGTAQYDQTRGELCLPALEAAGYHALRLGERECVLAIAPAQCYGVADALRAAGRPADARVWGAGVQIYALRHESGPGNGNGAGDFTSLAQCAEALAQAGADALAINPVHAGFSADPSRYSPYAPSSRLFLNPLYIDPAARFGAPAVHEAAAALGLADTLQQLDQLGEIDWPKLGRTRLMILRRLFTQRARLLGASQLQAYAQFCAAGGDALHSHACFEALHHFHAYDGTPASDWRDWPAAQRHPHDAAVTAFAEQHGEEVAFHQFLQWLAAEGLAAAQARAREAGMALGLIADLAVGTDASGSHAWSRQDEIFEGLEVGAPPDIYNPMGQSWGISAFSPRGLQRHGYRAFIEMLRAVLAHAGGLRIDHALGLARLWLIPKGAAPSEGAYVRFPFDDLMRLIKLESWRAHAIVIGENLGTVPAGFNPQLARHGLLGISVLWFETSQDDVGRTRFTPPQAWSRDAIATTTTHDLPSVAGWWCAHDLAWRARLNLFEQRDGGNGQAAAEQQRQQERPALWQACVQAGAASGPCPDADSTAPVEAALRFVGATPAQLVLVPLEDVLGLREQPNLPGTTAGHPNWQRRLAGAIRAELAQPEVVQRIAALSAARSLPQ
jgi:4-alpha-glucanotransferase